MSTTSTTTTLEGMAHKGTFMTKAYMEVNDVI